MDDKNKIFYAVKNDDGSVGEFKPFEIGEIPTPPPCETANIEKLCVTFNLCKEAAESIAVAIKTVIEAMCEFCIDIYNALYKSFTNNKKVVHLAMHAKKRRTRKKNKNRIIKYVLNQIERAGKIDEKDSDERD